MLTSASRTYRTRSTLQLLTCAVLSACLLQTSAFAFVTFKSSSGKASSWRPGRVVAWNVAEGAPAMVRESMLYATQIWSNATGGALQFQEAPGGIKVVWDPTGTMLYDPLFLAYASFSLDAESFISSGRIVINAKNYTWQRGGYGGVGPMVNGTREANLDAVMVHELGHALGLDHSDRDPAAVVQKELGGYPTMHSILMDGAASLHADDEAGISVLYRGGAPVIRPLPISASPTSGKKRVEVSFINQDGAADTQWDFGDGTVAQGASVEHKFIAYGTYTVTATSNGRTSSVEITVEKAKRKVKQTQPKPKRGK